MMKKTTLGTLFVALISLGNVGFAADGEVYSGIDLWLLDASLDTTLGDTIDGNPQAGRLRIGYYLTDRIALEFSSAFPTADDIVTGQGGTFDVELSQVTTFQARADLYTSESWRFYGVGGVTHTRLSVIDTSDPARFNRIEEAGVSLGLGGDYWVLPESMAVSVEFMNLGVDLDNASIAGFSFGVRFIM